MPQEPKKKHSKARSRTRRAAISLTALGLIKCPNCGKNMIPHQVCKSCGHYQGKQITTKTRATVTKV